MARSGALDAFCVYGAGDEIDPDGSYLVADYPTVVEDRELYPTEVVAGGLGLLYYGQQFTDVVRMALDQLPDATPQQIARALRYYDDHDTFLVF